MPCYTIVLYNVISQQVVYYGGPPTAMDAISDTIVNGGRAIVVIYRVLCYSSIRIVWAPAINDGCRFGLHFGGGQAIR